MSPQPGFVVVAAGTGSRLGAGVHKALVQLDGRPLVEHTLRRLLGGPLSGPCVVVAHPDDLAAMTELVAALPGPPRVVAGGAERQDSVAAGLAALPDSVDTVLVHDAARPFVPLEALTPLAEAARADGAALLAVPVADTIKRAGDDERVAATVDRSALWAAQTPQAFDRATLAELLTGAAARGERFTDEAALFEAAGRPVRLVPGSRLNLKLTTPEDLAIARALLAAPEEEGS